MYSNSPTIQRSRVGKQYESFNDKGGLNESYYEAVPLGILLTEKRFISTNIITEILSKYYFNLENQKQI